MAGYAPGIGQALMKRERVVADVDLDSEWRLRLHQLGDYWRVEVFAPEGLGIVFAKSLCESSETALESARNFLCNEKLDHVGAALAQMARAELKMSEGD
jgi:hypothetical protein